MKKISKSSVSRSALVFCFLLSFSAAKAQQLDSYILEAQQNNPDIQANELRYNLAEERVNEVNSLPNTEISAGYFVSEPETRTGAQKARFSVKQMIPWFGTITARENYAGAMADAEYVEIAIAKRKLALNVAQTYYNLYALREKQEVLQQNIKLLDTYEELALTSVQVDKASAVDVLKLQMRQNELQEQIEVLQQDEESARVIFSNLLNRENVETISIVDSLFLPEEEKIGQNELKIHPELLKFDRLYESVTQSEKVNLREASPQIGVGLDYIPVEERPEMSFNDNGKDIIMPMVSVSIPIFSKKYNSVSAQNELRLQEINSQKQERFNMLKTQLQTATSNRNSARISYNTQLKNLKQANDAEEILLKNYETGTIDFNDVLDIQELQLKFEIKLIDAVTKYYRETANINYLTN
ncbi:MAG: TolC family protein [Leeuwenhoekiella sp.]